MWQKKIPAEFEPWPSMATARQFLGALVKLEAEIILDGKHKRLPENIAKWILQQELAPLVVSRYKHPQFDWTSKVKEDAISASGEAQLYTLLLRQIANRFEKAGVTAVLLKGAALMQVSYPQPEWRTMSDIDIWVRREQLATAVREIEKLGFQAVVKEKRSVELQESAGGEIQFYATNGSFGMVELHWRPLEGWWLHRTAQIDDEGMWSRATWEKGHEGYAALAAEDMVLQVAVHLAVNHRFGKTPIRGLLDIAFTGQSMSVNWQTVAERAQKWRVATAVYTVLHLLDQLIGCEGAEVALDQLRPSALRRRLIARFVSPESVLAGKDLRNGRARYLFLLLLVDRPRDMLTLIFRTLWPEDEWMQARYGDRRVSRWQHIWQVLRYGQI